MPDTNRYIDTEICPRAMFSVKLNIMHAEQTISQRNLILSFLEFLMNEAYWLLGYCFIHCCSHPSSSFITFSVCGRVSALYSLLIGRLEFPAFLWIADIFRTLEFNWNLIIHFVCAV